MAATALKPAVASTVVEKHQEASTATTAPQPAEAFNDWPNDQGFDGDKDYKTPVELHVTGKIPKYAAGTLYRTGPGGYQVDTSKGTKFTLSHWFDGFSQVHRFQILPSEDGTTKVLYNSRTNVDPMIEAIRKSGSLDQFTFGQKRDPCQSYFKKIMSIFSPAKSGQDANIGVTLSPNMPGLKSARPTNDKEGNGHASGVQTLYAKTDAAVFKEIDPETLEPIGIARQSSLHPSLTGPMSGAHAKSDPVTGDIFNYNLDLGRKPKWRIFRTSASTGKTDILATIDSAEASYVHSIAITANHVILCVWNAYLSLNGLKLLWEQNVLDAISPFDPAKKTKWFVVDRSPAARGVVATYESDAFFCFHTVNAWEEPSPSPSPDGGDPTQVDIIVDLAAYDSLDILHRFYYENMRSSSPGARAYATPAARASTLASLNRFRLPAINLPPSSSPRPTTLVFTGPKGLSPELPTFHPRLFTRPHRYVYGVTDTGNAAFVDGLVKFDTRYPDDPERHVRWARHAQSPGEPIFVPDPAAGDLTGEREGEEDRGVLLSVVLDGRSGRSYLLVLDARSMEEVGRAEMESVVGFGFHGCHVPWGGRGGSS